MSWIPEDYDSEWPFDLLKTSFKLDPQITVLLIIDVQSGDLVREPDTALGQKYPEIVKYWNDRIDQFVIPNTKRLINHFRENRMRVVYTRNGNVTPHAVQSTERLKESSNPGDRYRGMPAYEIASQIYPSDDDLVVDKLTSSAFHNTMLDHALRNMGIRDVVIAGILTDMCVFGTARMAAEIGYNALICEDACATNTQRAHNEALLMHARVFGRVSTTQDALDELIQAKHV